MGSAFGRTSSPEETGNPYAPPRADIDAPSERVGLDAKAVRRKFARLESFAKAARIVSISVAVFEVHMVVYWAGWAVLAKLSAIVPPYPLHTASNIGLALGVPVVVASLTASYGLRHRRLWTSWTLGAFSLALFLQFAVLGYNDYQTH